MNSKTLCKKLTCILLAVWQLVCFFPLLLLTLGPGFVASGARRRPPPIHDISIDVDEDREVDVREHDWRFQFRHHSEEEEEDGANTQPEVASARLQTTQTR
ncbi:unnamed protein product, partial [Timema podura]|nr:unnamed protein product [Timema podura]